MDRSFLNPLSAAAILAGVVALGDLRSLAVAAGDTPPSVAAVAAAGTDLARQQDIESRIAKLIEQLGAEDYGGRERAQAELAQLGLEAFDALHAAQNHHDPEIALRARYLVRSMNVRWFSDSDASEAVRILQGYGDLQEGERSNRMDRLALLENRQGVVPLCRLSRFETIDWLAKYAALKVMDIGPPDDDAAKAELAKTIQGIVGNTKRPAAIWLSLYARTFSDPESTLPEWDQATQAEHATLTKNSDRTKTEIVRDLYRYQVELLKRLKHDDQAVAVIRRTFALLDGTPEQLQEIVDWLMQSQAFPVVLEVAKKFSTTFQDNPQLLYCLAETYQQLGQQGEAENAVAKALAIRPENLGDHWRMGSWLEHVRGWGKWAEREYREVVKAAVLGSDADIEGRQHLAELLHDQLQELPAADVLAPLCDFLKKDEAARDRTNAATLTARMHYFYACHYREQGDAAKEKTHLQAAVEGDPSHADVLIAMYRLAGADDAWKADVKQRIEKTAADTHAEIEDLRKTMDMNQSEPKEFAIRMSHFCNEYAWLVGNTFGDYDEAVKCSEEAVRLSKKTPEMQPNQPGYLDTLGRCYYGKGDLLNAVKYQSQAVKLNLFSGQMRRQLEFFIKDAKDRGINLPPIDVPPAAQTASALGKQAP